MGKNMSTEHIASGAKKIVLDFFELAFVRRPPELARDLYLGAEYKQHNPTAPDVAQVFPNLINSLLSREPRASFHLKRAIAEEDLVALHYHLQMFPKDPGMAVVDIFRVESGKIVEHWDVMQAVPALAANTNGMF
jgi:predicted SnoaL-like aldol condensation-catalyzing enzyme